MADAASKMKNKWTIRMLKRLAIALAVVLAQVLLVGCHGIIVTQSQPKPVAVLITNTQTPDSILSFSKAVILPPPPTNVTINFSWQPSPDSNVVGYKIYWGTFKGNYYTNGVFVLGSVTTATLKIVFPDYADYLYFVATSFDVLGNESPFSNEAHWPAYPRIMTGVHMDGVGQVTSSQNLSKWNNFTNLPAGGIDLPLGGMIRFFMGTNLNLKPIWFYPQ